MSIAEDTPPLLSSFLILRLQSSGGASSSWFHSPIGNGAIGVSIASELLDLLRDLQHTLQVSDGGAVLPLQARCGCQAAACAPLLHLSAAMRVVVLVERSPQAHKQDGSEYA